jgi:transposase
VQLSVESDLAGIDHCDEQIRKLELYLERSAKIDDPQSFFLLKSIPGIGKVLALTILYEIHSVDRFPTVGQFISYCRLVKCAHTSAGKSYGTGGAKIGNAHLRWAFGEAAVLLIRESPEAKSFVDRMTRKHGKPKAISILAAKVARTV